MIRRLRRLRIEPMPSQKRAARTSTDPMPSSPAAKAPARRRQDPQQIASDYLRRILTARVYDVAIESPLDAARAMGAPDTAALLENLGRGETLPLSEAGEAPVQ